MLTIKDFVKQYEAASNEELYHMYLHKEDYSPEGQEALSMVIECRGGVGQLETLWQQKQIIAKEKQKIRYEVTRLITTDTNLDFLHKMITSDLLSREELQQLISQQYHEVKQEQADVKITPRTIYGSILGGSIGALIGGIIWALQLLQMQRVFFILGIGLFLLSYGLIRLFTRQSKSNTAVLVASILSVGAAISLGTILFQLLN